MKVWTRLIPLAAVALGLASAPAFADIYTFKDESGVVHFTNIPSNDKRYRLLRKEGDGSSGMPMSRTSAIFMPSEAMIQRYSSIIDIAAKAYGVDKNLVHAVISAESGYNPYAVSRAGAMGIMQLMPDTARRYGVQNSLDPTQNIHGGVRYLKDLLVMFNGSVELAVAGYNAGENAVIRHGNRIPPYAETVHYVPKVLGFYRKFQSKKA